MGVTSDRDDPGLKSIGPDGMQEKYLVLSEKERAKGFVRPYRDRYKHVAVAGPTHRLRDLTPEEAERYAAYGYAKYEEYPQDDDSSVTGRFWTQERLDAARTCGSVTTMGRALSETYARDPSFYGATFCCACRTHRPVGADGEFVWIEADGSEGPQVGT